MTKRGYRRRQWSVVSRVMPVGCVYSVVGGSLLCGFGMYFRLYGGVGLDLCRLGEKKDTRKERANEVFIPRFWAPFVDGDEVEAGRKP